MDLSFEQSSQVHDTHQHQSQHASTLPLTVDALSPEQHGDLTDYLNTCSVHIAPLHACFNQGALNAVVGFAQAVHHAVITGSKGDSLQDDNMHRLKSSLAKEVVDSYKRNHTPVPGFLRSFRPRLHVDCRQVRAVSRRLEVDARHVVRPERQSLLVCVSHCGLNFPC